jgi:hypothetical protein
MGSSKVGVFLVWHKTPQIWNGSWPSSFGLRRFRRTYHTILKLADHALFKIVRFVLLWPQRPELDGQDPFQICGVLCQTRKTPTLVDFMESLENCQRAFLHISWGCHLPNPWRRYRLRINSIWQSFSDPAISSDSDSDWSPKFGLGLGLKKSWLSYTLTQNYESMKYCYITWYLCPLRIHA